MEEKVMASDVTFEGKPKVKLPKGAEVIKKEVRITVEEIENGFIVKKSYDITFTLGEKTDYLYYTKKVFSDDNPIQIEDDKMLADYFD
jgi:hypothetical protein